MVKVNVLDLDGTELEVEVGTMKVLNFSVGTFAGIKQLIMPHLKNMVSTDQFDMSMWYEDDGRKNVIISRLMQTTTLIHNLNRDGVKGMKVIAPHQLAMMPPNQSYVIISPVDGSANFYLAVAFTSGTRTTFEDILTMIVSRVEYQNVEKDSIHLSKTERGPCVFKEGKAKITLSGALVRNGDILYCEIEC